MTADVNTQRLFLIAASCVHILSGCVEVSSPVVVGSRALAVESSEWGGTWRNSDGFEFELTVVDGTAGVLSVSWVQSEGGSQTSIVSTGYIRSIDGRTLFSIKIPDKESSTDQYLFGRVEKRGDEMFVIPPHLFWFKRFVEDGTLSGEAHLGQVVLRDVTSPEMEVFVTRWMHFIFDVENPMIFRRQRVAGQLGIAADVALDLKQRCCTRVTQLRQYIAATKGHAAESRCSADAK